jgi:SAM-dependent methyltransferase
MGGMPLVPDSSPAYADRTAPNDYDSFAEAYADDSESNLVNGYYCRPAILDLAGEVAGRRILDVGCASGAVFEALRDRGAAVTGIDSSAEMVNLARRRLGDDADLHRVDIAGPLPFPGGAFDDVIASLVLHYLEDWTAPLAELRRVLAPGGRLIIAVNHPLLFPLVHPGAGYFAIQQWSDENTFSGHQAVLTYWHRPLHAMTEAFTAAGFRIAVISEPAPAPAARELFPDQIAAKPRFLCFLFFVLEAGGDTV